jgi:ABC-2 type transport system permease protein
VRDGALVAAKLVACVLVVAGLLAGTLTYPLFLAGVQPMPWAAVAASYLGLLLLGISFSAIGLFISSLTDSQVVAAVATLGVLLAFWALSWNEAALTPAGLSAAASLSMFDHFEAFSRGVVDAGDLAYFATLSAFFVFGTLRVLEARHWRGRR